MNKVVLLLFFFNELSWFNSAANVNNHASTQGFSGNDLTARVGEDLLFF